MHSIRNDESRYTVLVFLEIVELKILLLMISVILSSNSFACGGFGNGGDGCADAVAGVQTEGGTKIEITTSGTTWYPDQFVLDQIEFNLLEQS